MCVLFLASLSLLVCSRPCAGQGDEFPPFEVKVIEESEGRKLECTTSTGFPVEQAVFFRNGVQENTTDACLPASQGGLLPFNNTPECDGHYSCGKVADDGFILSGPKTVLGTPKTMTTEAHTLPVCLNCTANIPSNLHVSALNAQEVIWFRIRQSVTEQVKNPQINADYSLTLIPVRRSDAATYFARATNTDGAYINSPPVDLMVIEKPYIVDVSVHFDVDDSVQVTVTARGDDLTYKWKVNNYLPINENSNTFTIPALSKAKTKISVNVSNAIGFDFRTTLVKISSKEGDVSQPTMTTLATSTETEEASRTDQYCIDHMVMYIAGACFALLAILVAVIACVSLLSSKLRRRKVNVNMKEGKFTIEEVDSPDCNDKQSDSHDPELSRLSSSASEKTSKQ